MIEKKVSDPIFPIFIFALLFFVSFYDNIYGVKNLDELTRRIIAFRDARDWKQFHNPKDCAISLSLEASELLEHFQWKNAEEMKEYIKTHKEHIGDELADVLYWVLLMSYDLNIDIIEVSNKKLKQNNEKYSVEKAKGKHTKYNKL